MVCYLYFTTILKMEKEGKLDRLSCYNSTKRLKKKKEWEIRSTKKTDKHKIWKNSKGENY